MLDEQTMEEFYDAYYWLANHPVFHYSGEYGLEMAKNGIIDTDFPHQIEVAVVKVNPQNETIEDDDSLNTAVRVWLEANIYLDPDFYRYMHNDMDHDVDTQHDSWQWRNYGMVSHDVDLDTGSTNFEDAIISLADEVMKKYGDYKHVYRTNLVESIDEFKCKKEPQYREFRGQYRTAKDALI